MKQLALSTQSLCYLHIICFNYDIAMVIEAKTHMGISMCFLRERCSILCQLSLSFTTDQPTTSDTTPDMQMTSSGMHHDQMFMIETLAFPHIICEYLYLVVCIKSVSPVFVDCILNQCHRLNRAQRTVKSHTTTDNDSTLAPYVMNLLTPTPSAMFKHSIATSK